ncbi:YqaA family protein [Aquibium oceanicum]|uniref:VTT domain-containing protein n=1 Tax=Aquibium oceanicum TaxID=1670800 RepID=A0A1L3SQL5_9HYPH|nr:YqaA family protein [Aquibium oceanicum]APH71696.1 hypothetical protein BSQ44_10200 [Aquibium oceanicum]
MPSDLAVYAGLFGLAFAAATIFPAQSEAALAGLIALGNQPTMALVAVASVGNVLGSLVNWLLGRGLERFRDRKWFPAGDRTLDQASAWYRRYGRWTLLLSWAPFIGDPLTIVAGVLREPLWSFLLLVTIAKVGRYVLLAVAVSGL